MPLRNIQQSANILLNIHRSDSWMLTPALRLEFTRWQSPVLTRNIPVTPTELSSVLMFPETVAFPLKSIVTEDKESILPEPL